MTEVPPFLFIVTSTALVLGAAITIRGLLGFRPIAENTALPTLVPDDTPPVAVQAMAEATVRAESPAADQPAPEATSAVAATPAHVVRDLKEPIVMTIAGLLICMLTIVAIAALINSA